MQKLIKLLADQNFIKSNKYNTEAIMKILAEKHPRCKERGFLDFEVLLEALHQCINSDDIPISYLGYFDDKAMPNNVNELVSHIYAFLRRIMYPDNSLDYMRYIERFYKDFGLAIVFTTNYDICLESYCLTHNIPLYDAGIHTSISSPSISLLPQVNLFKLHGSMLWIKGEGALIENIPASLARDISRSLENKDVERMMIFPAVSKDLGRPPYSHLHRHLSYILQHIDTLVIIGYSFHDEYLIDLLEIACRENTRLAYVYVDPRASINVMRIRPWLNYRYGTSQMLSRIIAYNVDVSVLAEMSTYDYYTVHFADMLRNKNYTSLTDMVMKTDYSAYLNLNEDNIEDPIYDARMPYIREKKYLYNYKNINDAISIILLPQLAADYNNVKLQNSNKYLDEASQLIGLSFYKILIETSYQGIEIDGLERAQSGAKYIKIFGDDVKEIIDVQFKCNCSVLEHVSCKYNYEIYKKLANICISIPTNTKIFRKARYILGHITRFFQMGYEIQILAENNRLDEIVKLKGNVEEMYKKVIKSMSLKREYMEVSDYPY